MHIIIIAGLLNIVASIAFLAWSETRPSARRERKAIQHVSTLEGLSCGQLRLLRGIANAWASLWIEAVLKWASMVLDYRGYRAGVVPHGRWSIVKGFLSHGVSSYTDQGIYKRYNSVRLVRACNIVIASVTVGYNRVMGCVTELWVV